MPSPSEASSSRQSSTTPEEDDSNLEPRNQPVNADRSDEDGEEDEAEDSNQGSSDHDIAEEGEAPRESASFEELGVIKPLLTALEQMNFHKPTEIQESVIPLALAGKDIIGVAETVSCLAHAITKGVDVDLSGGWSLLRDLERPLRSRYRSCRSCGTSQKACSVWSWRRHGTSILWYLYSM